ncbi:MAG: uroporphyrinogen decarboxylase family protein, partial [Actinomycetota bacterium]|nr:uroporphyrinogen decarboxylase family protein [Actinomycetota bacterium]
MIPAAQRVRDALAFEPVLVAGLTFVPPEVIRELRWGVGGGPGLLAVACTRLELDFIFVPSWEPWAEEALDRVAACGVAPLWVVQGPLGVIAESEGWSETLRSSAADPDGLGRRMGEIMPSLREKVRRGVGLGATAIVVADDLAGADGPLVAPDFALDQILPRTGSMAAEAAEHAVPAIFHSDGDVRWAVPALRRQGFAAVHPGGLTGSAFDAFAEVCREHDLAVLGGLSRGTLAAGGPAVLRAAASASVRTLQGGLLISDDGGISTSTELASLVTAIQALRSASRGESKG